MTITALLVDYLQRRLVALGPMTPRVSVPDDRGLMAVEPQDFRGVAIPTERPRLTVVTREYERRNAK